MAHTVARVSSYALDMVGTVKITQTDVTWSGATASESVTAAELGLTTIDAIENANIQAGVASATGVEASSTLAALGASTTIALNTATGAGTGQSGSVVRVTARGR